MEGFIKNYRRGRRTMHRNQMIVEVTGIASKAKASPLKGKTATWITPSGKKMTGTVMDAHGDKGAVRIRFPKGLPGEAVGTKLSIQ